MIERRNAFIFFAFFVAGAGFAWSPSIAETGHGTASAGILKSDLRSCKNQQNTQENARKLLDMRSPAAGKANEEAMNLINSLDSDCFDQSLPFFAACARANHPASEFLSPRGAIAGPERPRFPGDEILKTRVRGSDYYFVPTRDRKNLNTTIRVCTALPCDSKTTVAWMNDYQPVDENGKVLAKSDGIIDQIQLSGQVEMDQTGLSFNSGKIVKLPLNQDRFSTVASGGVETSAGAAYKEAQRVSTLNSLGFKALVHEKTPGQMCRGNQGDPAKLFDYVMNTTGWNPKNTNFKAWHTAYAVYMTQYDPEYWSAVGSTFKGSAIGVWNGTGGVLKGLGYDLPKAIYTLSTDEQAKAAFKKALGDKWDAFDSECRRGADAIVNGDNSPYTNEMMISTCVVGKVLTGAGKAIVGPIIKCFDKSFVHTATTAKDSEEVGKCIGEAAVLAFVTVASAGTVTAGRAATARVAQISEKLVAVNRMTPGRQAILQAAQMKARAAIISATFAGETMGLGHGGANPMKKADAAIENMVKSLDELVAKKAIKEPLTAAQVEQLSKHLYEVARTQILNKERLARGMKALAAPEAPKELYDLLGKARIESWSTEVATVVTPASKQFPARDNPKQGPIYEGAAAELAKVVSSPGGDAKAEAMGMAMRSRPQAERDLFIAQMKAAEAHDRQLAEDLAKKSVGANESFKKEALNHRMQLILRAQNFKEAWQHADGTLSGGKEMLARSSPEALSGATAHAAPAEFQVVKIEKEFYAGGTEIRKYTIPDNLVGNEVRTEYFGKPVAGTIVRQHPSGFDVLEKNGRIHQLNMNEGPIGDLRLRPSSDVAGLKSALSNERISLLSAQPGTPNFWRLQERISRLENQLPPGGMENHYAFGTDLPKAAKEQFRRPVTRAESLALAGSEKTLDPRDLHTWLRRVEQLDPKAYDEAVKHLGSLGEADRVKELKVIHESLFNDAAGKFGPTKDVDLAKLLTKPPPESSALAALGAADGPAQGVTEFLTRQADNPHATPAAKSSTGHQIDLKKGIGTLDDSSRRRLGLHEAEFEDLRQAEFASDFAKQPEGQKVWRPGLDAASIARSDKVLKTLSGQSHSKSGKAIASLMRDMGFEGKTLLPAHLEPEQIRSVIKDAPALEGFLHELPGIEILIDQYDRGLISEASFKNRLRGNLFHNGPNKGFWAFLTNKLVPDSLKAAADKKNLWAKEFFKGTVFEGPGGKITYPNPQGIGLIHATYDRLSQGTGGGMIKILREIDEKGFMKPHSIINDMLNNNPKGSLDQMIELDRLVRKDPSLSSETRSELVKMITNAKERLPGFQERLANRVQVSGDIVLIDGQKYTNQEKEKMFAAFENAVRDVEKDVTPLEKLATEERNPVIYLDKNRKPLSVEQVYNGGLSAAEREKALRKHYADAGFKLDDKDVDVLMGVHDRGKPIGHQDHGSIKEKLSGSASIDPSVRMNDPGYRAHFTGKFDTAKFHDATKAAMDNGLLGKLPEPAAAASASKIEVGRRAMTMDVEAGYSGFKNFKMETHLGPPVNGVSYTPGIESTWDFEAFAKDLRATAKKTFLQLNLEAPRTKDGGIFDEIIVSGTRDSQYGGAFHLKVVTGPSGKEGVFITDGVMERLKKPGGVFVEDDKLVAAIKKQTDFVRKAPIGGNFYNDIYPIQQETNAEVRRLFDSLAQKLPTERPAISTTAAAPAAPTSTTLGHAPAAPVPAKSAPKPASVIASPAEQAAELVQKLNANKASVDKAFQDYDVLAEAIMDGKWKQYANAKQLKFADEDAAMTLRDQMSRQIYDQQVKYLDTLIASITDEIPAGLQTPELKKRLARALEARKTLKKAPPNGSAPILKPEELP